MRYRYELGARQVFMAICAARSTLCSRGHELRAHWKCEVRSGRLGVTVLRDFGAGM